MIRVAAACGASMLLCCATTKDVDPAQKARIIALASGCGPGPDTGPRLGPGDVPVTAEVRYVRSNARFVMPNSPERLSVMDDQGSRSRALTDRQRDDLWKAYVALRTTGPAPQFKFGTGIDAGAMIVFTSSTGVTHWVAMGTTGYDDARALQTDDHVCHAFEDIIKANGLVDLLNAPRGWWERWLP